MKRALISCLLATPAWAGPWAAVTTDRTERPQTRSPEERLDRASFVADLVRLAPRGELPGNALDKAKGLGMVVSIEDGGWVIRETEPTGGGVYAIRPGDTPPVFCQSPHPWSDLDTGRLTEALWQTGSCRVAAWSTTHRKVMDAAHVHDTLFQAITDQVVDAMLNPVVVQIHGFANASADADAVLSTGATPMPEKRLVTIMQGVRETTGWRVKSGGQIPDLAATKNLQGRIVSLRARFFHLELSRDVRQSLVDDLTPLVRALHVMTSEGGQ